MVFYMCHDLTTFAGRMEAAMCHQKIGQNHLAQELNIARQTISAIKKGGQPGRKHLPALAKALNVSMDWLHTGDPTHAPTWALAMSTSTSSSLATDAARMETVLQAMREANGTAETRARMQAEIDQLRTAVANLQGLAADAEQRARDLEEERDALKATIKAERSHYRAQLEALSEHVPHASALARRVGRGLPWKPPTDP